MNTEKEKIARSLMMMRKCAFFKEFSSLELEKFHFFMTKKHYFNGQSIFKNETLSDGIHIVKSGNFEVFKMLEFDENGDSFDRTTKIELAELKTNDVFGEIELLLQQKKRQYSVLCNNGGETFFIHKIVFFNFSAPFSLKIKKEQNDRKLEIMNNNFIIRGMNRTKVLTEVNSEFKRKDRDHTFQTIIPKRAPLDVNFHGFGENARLRGQTFDKSLDILLGSFSKIGYDTLMENKISTINKPKLKQTDNNLLQTLANFDPFAPSNFIQKSTLSSQFTPQSKTKKSQTTVFLPIYCRDKL